MVRRKNGFQAPYSDDQKASWVVYPLLVSAYYLVVGLNLSHVPYQVHLLWVHAALTVPFLIAYVAVERIDAADFMEAPNIRVVCFPRATEKTRYCAQCAKSVVGLDHHCTWLNTCVGIQNYVPFISLVTIGFTQMSLQTAVGVLSLLPSIHDSDHKEWTTDRLGESYVYYILIGAYLLASLSLLIAFGILLSFHLYLLLYVRVGTYEWMMGGRVEYSGGVKPNKEDIVEQDNKKKRERFEAARQVALKEAMARDIASRGEAEPDEEAGQSQPRTTAGRARGYDRLTVFPEGDKELEMSTGERVSSEMAITETDAARTSASQNL